MADHGKNGVDRLKFDTSRRKLVEALRGSGAALPELDQFVGRGGLAISVGMQDGKVLLEFGEDTKWIKFTPQQAADLAGLFLRSAKAVARVNGDTVAWPVIGG